MRCKLTFLPMKTLAQAAGCAVLDTAAAIYEGISAAGRQAEDVLSRVRLEKEVRDIEEEIDWQLRSAGESLYAAHCGDTSASGEIEAVMEYIDDLREELEAHRQEKEILKGNLICAACGEVNRANSLYCQNCGDPLSRP